MYQRYFEAFPKVWTASAFKGMSLCLYPTLSFTETNNKLQLSTTKALYYSINARDIYIYGNMMCLQVIHCSERNNSSPTSSP